MSETSTRIAQVRAWLKSHDLDGVAFASRANFAWLSSGGDNHIVSQSELGVGTLVVTKRQAVVVANTIEIGRLTAEEPLSEFTAKSFPWTQPTSAALTKLLPKGRYVGDDGSLGLPGLPGDFVDTLRAPLGDQEVRRYKALGRECSLVLETVCRSIAVGDSEQQAEADLARHLLARGIQPFVLLAAFDERIRTYRHPTPTPKKLRKHGMLVVCGQRHGLIASLTRFIHFGAVPADLRKRHAAVCRVEAAYWEATVPGATWAQAFAAGHKQYKTEGFAKEWELHHQGGPTGYAGRDLMATPSVTRKVVERQAVAWNPSITGTKTEDTFIIDGDDRIVVTACSDQWPTIEVATPNGATLVRPDILVR